ncbi:hypothetical protein [Candidatus Steffania adelgidicola]|uniref:hypothetical protein n=1 Tax=Candidatus Steffania adelgidicola TaxID=1076626 RepID=UPI001D014E2F|nr:hypothetical protein [Candidatus Steffania adelgidicola]
MLILKRTVQSPIPNDDHIEVNPVHGNVITEHFAISVILQYIKHDVFANLTRDCYLTYTGN